MSKLVKNLLYEALRGKKRNVGVLIKAENTGRFLLLKRAGDPHKGTFALLSGGLNPDEEPLEGLKRETFEETKATVPIQYKYINKEISDKAEFYYFHGIVKEEFIPKLDFENLAFVWCDKDNLPSPLYPNLELKISKF